MNKKKLTPQNEASPDQKTLNHYSTTVNPKDVIIGQRARKLIGWLDSLERSISKHGVLQPIGITTENVLVFGERRLRACINLGIEEVPCRVIDVNPDDPATFLRMERDENNERRDFTPEEKIAIASSIESKLVGRHGGDRKSDQEANVSPLKGKSHEIAAAAVGMGKDTYRKAKAVFSEADEATKEAVNNGEKSIHKAYVETKAKHAPSLFESRGVGVRMAHEAIAVLKRIPLNDGLRQDAFDMVQGWIDTNRGGEL